jgi:nitrous oxide reductase accessory protein NosL
MNSQDSQTIDRRTLLTLFGASLGSLAGCATSNDDAGDTTATPTPTATPSADVPDQYRTATARNGQQRDPDALSAQADVNYQAQPKDGQRCSGCQFYVPDKNGDGTGACAIVAGTVEPDGWCVSYVAYEADEDTTVQARDVPADAKCAVCEMKAADFPDWNAQAVHTDATREFFCSTGCATTYYAAPGEFAETDADIAGLWVRDVSSGELIDGTDAHYALETESDRLDDPMRLNPAAFGTREAALAYVDAVDYLTPDDIVELSAFDRELARRYRDRFLE